MMAMSYNEMLETLYSVHPEMKIKLGLDRIEALLNCLGSPQKSFRYVHVAGTNGKGTVTKTIGSILKAHGLKVGTYFSPHVETFRERIRFNDECISEDDVVQVFEEVMSCAEKFTGEMKPTFFEIVTAMAFTYFRKMKANIVVAEVGLGGRFDATNVVENPLATVITTVDYDHIDILGEELESIAFEKAGIVKKNVPLVIGKMKEPPLEVIKSRAKELEAPVYIFGKDYKISDIHLELGKNAFNFSSGKVKHHFETRMNGKQAMENMAVALKALEILESEKLFTFDEKQTFDTIFTLNLEGRFEWLPSDVTTIIDAAHNKPAMKVLACNLNEYFPNRKVNAVVGILNDKDYKGMIDELVKSVNRLYITTPKSERATDAFGIYKWAATKYNKIGYLPEIEDAVKVCHDMCKSENSVMVVSGSFYTIGTARSFLTGEVIRT